MTKLYIFDQLGTPIDLCTIKANSKNLITKINSVGIPVMDIKYDKDSNIIKYEDWKGNWWDKSIFKGDLPFTTFKSLDVKMRKPLSSLHDKNVILCLNATVPMTYDNLKVIRNIRGGVGDDGFHNKRYFDLALIRSGKCVMVSRHSFIVSEDSYGSLNEITLSIRVNPYKKT